MPGLVFIPYARLVWIATLPADCQAMPEMAELARRIEDGEWPLPPEWLAWLCRHFALPDGLLLRAQVQGRLLIITPWPPLVEKRPGAARALCPPLELKPAQRAVLQRLARGMSVPEVAKQMQRTPRWVHYQIRGARLTRAALLRSQHKKRKFPKG